MTPRRPIELVQASQDCAEAWSKRDAMIDAGDTVGVKAMDLTCDILDERCQKIYREWQILGGTSNIESIALPLPAEHYEGTPKGAELRFGNVIFDLDAMGENARQRSAVLKAQIDQRREEARERLRQDSERVRKAGY